MNNRIRMYCYIAATVILIPVFMLKQLPQLAKQPTRAKQAEQK